MRFSKLTSFLVAAALAVAPTSFAFAEPTVIADVAPATTAPAPTPVADADLYAAREAKDADVQKFRGGERSVVIGVSTVSLLLIILILVIVL